MHSCKGEAGLDNLGRSYLNMKNEKGWGYSSCFLGSVPRSTVSQSKHVPIIPVLWGPRQEDCRFQPGLGKLEN